MSYLIDARQVLERVFQLDGKIEDDLVEIEKKFGLYVERERVASPREILEEPLIALKPARATDQL